MIMPTSTARPALRRLPSSHQCHRSHHRISASPSVEVLDIFDVPHQLGNPASPRGFSSNASAGPSQPSQSAVSQLPEPVLYSGRAHSHNSRVPMSGAGASFFLPSSLPPPQVFAGPAWARSYSHASAKISSDPPMSSTQTEPELEPEETSITPETLTILPVLALRYFMRLKAAGLLEPSFLESPSSSSPSVSALSTSPTNYRRLIGGVFL